VLRLFPAFFECSSGHMGGEGGGGKGGKGCEIPLLVVRFVSPGGVKSTYKSGSGFRVLFCSIASERKGEVGGIHLDIFFFFAPFFFFPRLRSEAEPSSNMWSLFLSRVYGIA